MVKVLLATGSDQLDNSLEGGSRWQVVGRVLYREAVLEKRARTAAGVVVLAVSLPGRASLLEVVYNLRRENSRVILLAGTKGEMDAGDLRKTVQMGVYDFIFNPVREEDVARAILEPAGFNQVAAWLAPADSDGDQGPGDARPAPGLNGVDRRGLWQSILGFFPAPSHPEEQSAVLGRKVPSVKEVPVGQKPGRDKEAPPLPGKKQVVVLTSPRGGVGKSFLTCSLGSWCTCRQKKTLLIDFDVERGNLNRLLPLVHPGQGVFTRYRGRGGQVALAEHQSGLSVLTLLSGRCEEEEVQSLLQSMMDSFALVIVDTAATLNTHTVWALKKATGIVMVATPERSVLNDVRAEYDRYLYWGLDPARINLALNRVPWRPPLKESEVRSLIPFACFSVIPEGPRIPADVYRGFTHGSGRLSRRYWREIDKLGRKLFFA